MKYTPIQKKLLVAADKILNGAISLLGKTLPDGPSFTSNREEKYSIRLGDEKFLSEPAKNSCWSLGYGSNSLVPDDIFTHDYYIGGYFMPANKFCNRVESVYDDMRVRAIAIDDGSGRGVNVFAEVDSIGIAGGDIREITHKFEKKCGEHFPEIKICTSNICSTHTHSCIDTEGLWTGGIKRILTSFSPARRKKLKFVGLDPAYKKFLTERIVNAMLLSVKAMEPGRLEYCKKDIGNGYFTNKNRPSASSLDTNLTRLLFVPKNPKSKKTYLAFIAAHPDVAGMPLDKTYNTGRLVSGDYIYYMDKLVRETGSNFILFNGAIAGIYMSRNLTNDGLPMNYRAEQSERYGTELAKIMLNMEKSSEQIENELTDDERNIITAERLLSGQSDGSYTVWYDGLEQSQACEVEPIFNIKKKLVELNVENPIIILAGKLGLANFAVIRNLLTKKYGIRTQIGYIEIGREMKICMVPGEYCQDLLCGGTSLHADGSFWGREYGLASLREIFGENSIAMGLANDEIGYIVPDNDYILSDFKNHYHEELSLGKNTASAITKGFIGLKNDLVYTDKL